MSRHHLPRPVPAQGWAQKLPRARSAIHWVLPTPHPQPCSPPAQPPRVSRGPSARTSALGQTTRTSFPCESQPSRASTHRREGTPIPVVVLHALVPTPAPPPSPCNLSRAADKRVSAGASQVAPTHPSVSLAPPADNAIQQDHWQPRPQPCSFRPPHWFERTCFVVSLLHWAATPEDGAL